MRVLLAAFLGLATTIASASGAAPGRQIIGSEQDHSLASMELNDCSHFYTTTFTSFRAQIHEQEQREFVLTGIDQLRVIADEEGSVTVRGWDRPDARLIVCRYAASHTKAQAAQILKNVVVSHANGEISATGPAIDTNTAWWVNMTLYVPRKAKVDIHATTGGVAIRNMSGNVTASATSGGISVAQSSGRYRISTDMGGITLDRVSGTIDASSKKGAIALKLAVMNGQNVEAKIAEGGEILCTLRGCDAALWGAGQRQLRIGAGQPQIRLSTVAAPILIGPVTF